ncbi:hypothetical protein Tco_0468615 [Tanacetum coccineum]
MGMNSNYHALVFPIVARYHSSTQLEYLPAGIETHQHALASKRQSAFNDQLLKNLKAKFQWVATQAGKLGITPPSQLTAFELPTTLKKGREKQREPEAGIYLYNGNFDLVFQRISEYQLASITQLIMIQNLINVDSEYAQQVYGTDISKITRKQLKNGQARTRESEEYKKKPKNQSRS